MYQGLVRIHDIFFMSILIFVWSLLRGRGRYLFISYISTDSKNFQSMFSEAYRIIELRRQNVFGLSTPHKQPAWNVSRSPSCQLSFLRHDRMFTENNVSSSDQISLKFLMLMIYRCRERYGKVKIQLRSLMLQHRIQS